MKFVPQIFILPQSLSTMKFVYQKVCQPKTLFYRVWSTTQCPQHKLCQPQSLSTVQLFCHRFCLTHRVILPRSFSTRESFNHCVCLPCNLSLCLILFNDKVYHQTYLPQSFFFKYKVLLLTIFSITKIYPINKVCSNTNSLNKICQMQSFFCHRICSSTKSIYQRPQNMFNTKLLLRIPSPTEYTLHTVFPSP